MSESATRADFPASGEISSSSLLLRFCDASEDAEPRRSRLDDRSSARRVLAGDEVPSLMKFGLELGSSEGVYSASIYTGWRIVSRSGDEVPNLTKFGDEASSTTGSSSRLELRPKRIMFGLEELL